MGVLPSTAHFHLLQQPGTCREGASERHWLGERGRAWESLCSPRGVLLGTGASQVEAGASLVVKNLPANPGDVRD